MDLHRVWRLGSVLVASQLRSGRSSSDPKSVFGRPALIGVADAIVFLGAFALAELVLGSVNVPASVLSAVVRAVLPYIPLIAVAAVLVAGVMFELTSTAKFSGSDSVNWLPLTPEEYVAASSAAVAYTYSPAIAFFLGALLPFALATGTFLAWGVALALSVVSLFEGAFVVEMVRSVTQRMSAVNAGRRGQVTLVLRAVLIIVVILAFQFAFNPVLLFGLLQHSATLDLVTALVPLFWSTQALTDWLAGAPWVGLLFALGQVGFVALLLLAAARLRVRFWVVTASEVRLAAVRYASGHPALRALGLSATEAAIVSKDLRGYVRRRELLPMLVIPVVLIVIVLIEGGSFGGLGAILWIGWVAGFFALLLAVTSVGQERRSLQSLYAFPITAGNVLRAKAAGVLLPALIAVVGTSVAIGLLFGFSPIAIVWIALLNTGAAVVLCFWGLVFAGRYSDFQDRPRPQYLRPAAMLGAMGSGMILLFAIVIPGGLAILNPVVGSLALMAWTIAAVLVAGFVALQWARSGFDRMLRELPF
jgi:hypothetical protein